MGANIGTTVTGLLIALDVGELAPLFAFVGVAMVVSLSSWPQLQHFGQILVDLGVLFIGMDMMSGAMSPAGVGGVHPDDVQFLQPAAGDPGKRILYRVIQSPPPRWVSFRRWPTAV